MSQEFITSELTDFNFYKNKMSLFMQGSFGMTDRMKIYYDILMNVLTCSENIFTNLNVGADNYFVKTGIDPNATTDKWLDIAGSILGIQRDIVLPDINPGSYVQLTTSSSCTLTNYSFLIYILATICKNRFDGTRESLRKFYTGTTIPNFDQLDMSDFPQALQDHLNSKNSYSLLSPYHVIYYTSSTLSVTCYIRTGEASEEIIRLFYAGYLTIESMGITYTYVLGASMSGGYFITAAGYYYNDSFYSDSDHTQLITPISGGLYYDLHADKSYVSDGSEYEEVSPTITGFFDYHYDAAHNRQIFVYQ